MVNAAKIEETIAEALPGSTVRVTDMTGTGDHFNAVVIWDGFEGKGLVEQHQLVMTPLKEELKEAIHALAIKTFTTNKWKEQNKQPF